MPGWQLNINYVLFPVTCISLLCYVDNFQCFYLLVVGANGFSFLASVLLTVDFLAFICFFMYLLTCYEIQVCILFNYKKACCLTWCHVLSDWYLKYQWCTNCTTFLFLFQVSFYIYAKVQFVSTPLLFHREFQNDSLGADRYYFPAWWRRPWATVIAGSFKKFKTMLRVHQRHRRIDRQMDGWLIVA